MNADSVNRSDVNRLIQEALQAQAIDFHRQMAEALLQANIILPAPGAGGSPHLSSPHTQVSSNCNTPLPIEQSEVIFNDRLLYIYDVSNSALTDVCSFTLIVSNAPLFEIIFLNWKLLDLRF